MSEKEQQPTMDYSQIVAQYNSLGTFRARIKVNYVQVYNNNWCMVRATPVVVQQGKPYYAHGKQITIADTFENIPNVYEEYQFVGFLAADEKGKYAPSYRMTHCGKEFFMDTPEDRRRFLQSILTENQVKNLYDAFTDPFEIIGNGDIDELQKVKGVGETVAKRILRKYTNNAHRATALAFFADYHVGDATLRRILDTFGNAENAVEAIKENPYNLMQVDGIGFKKADKIALQMGTPLGAENRYRAAVKYLMEHKVEENGSCFMQFQEFLTKEVLPLIGVQDFDYDKAQEIVHDMHVNKEVFVSFAPPFTTTGIIASYDTYASEASIYLNLKRLMEAPSTIAPPDDLKQTLGLIEEKQGFEFTYEQVRAIETVVNNNVVIITGRGGTGKSSVSNGFLNIYPGKVASLCALSGRAACRIEEVSGKPASTIHKLISDSRLDSTDILVIDEASMIDVKLFAALLSKVPNGSKVIIMGDVAQLETIGCGNVLGDLLRLNRVPCVRLTQIHRQAAKSAIITEASKVADGIQLTPDGWTGINTRGELQDLTLHIYNGNTMDEFTARALVLSYWKQMYEQCKDIRQMAIITPRKDRTFFNAMDLNNEIQEYYNPRKFREDGSQINEEIDFKKSLEKKPDKKTADDYTEERCENMFAPIFFRQGDRVMNMKNKYKTLKITDNLDIGELLSANSARYLEELKDEGEELERTKIFNGYLGTIKRVSKFGMIVHFDRAGKVFIPAEDFQQIDLGYASTVHKYQGSECDNVIFAMNRTAGYTSLTRQMLYTGITRAKKRCVLVTDAVGLKTSIITEFTSNKKTLLPHFYAGLLVPPPEVLDYVKKKTEATNYSNLAETIGDTFIEDDDEVQEEKKETKSDPFLPW